jgi:hypothetical protein
MYLHFEKAKERKKKGREVVIYCLMVRVPQWAWEGVHREAAQERDE